VPVHADFGKPEVSNHEQCKLGNIGVEVVFTFACWVLLSALALPAITFVVEVVLGSFQSRAAPEERPSWSSVPRPRIAVLVPAHNESSGIVDTLRSVRSQLRHGDRLLVVADNCHDDTAAVARSLGAEVTERFDEVLRGKGYALDHGVSVLRLDPPAMVLMVDADCVLHPGAVDALSQSCAGLLRPVQAQYLMRSPAGASIQTRVAEFAWLVKNRVRPLGAHRLGWPCQLTGSGMMFPWALIAAAPLASGHLVEDMQLGVELAKQGLAPAYCDQALVTSTFPADEEDLATQRQRWEHGHLSMILSQGLSTLKHSLGTLSWPLLGMALDLCVPPLTSLIMLMGLALPLAWGHGWAFGGTALATISTVLFFSINLAVILAWSMHGRVVLPKAEVLGIPAYAFSKISVYASFMVRRQVKWVRTGRDSDCR